MSFYINSKHEETLRKFGKDICREAYRLHARGEGAFTVGTYLDIKDKLGRINVRRADAMIDAGRYLNDKEYYLGGD